MRGRAHTELETTDAAQAALARGDIATAEQICARLVSIDPGNGRAFALLTETALLRGRLDAALVCAARAVDGAPQDAIAHLMLAKARFGQGDLIGALDAAEKAASLPACLAADRRRARGHAWIAWASSRRGAPMPPRGRRASGDRAVPL